MNSYELKMKSREDLLEIAKQKGVPKPMRFKKDDLVEKIMERVVRAIQEEELRNMGVPEEKWQEIVGEPPEIHANEAMDESTNYYILSENDRLPNENGVLNTAQSLKKRGRPRKNIEVKNSKVPGKRGRPRKNPEDVVPKVPQKRGRPRKNIEDVIPKVPQKRGRPRKNTVDIIPKAPQKRGRPRKYPVAEIAPQRVEETFVETPSVKPLAAQAQTNFSANGTAAKPLTNATIAEQEPKEVMSTFIRGILEVMQEGYGFVHVENCMFSDQDVHISSEVIKRFGLRGGDEIEGYASAIKANDRPSMVDIRKIGGFQPERAAKRPVFEKLTPIYPNERFTLENENSASEIAVRLIDLIAPIGKGQRGLIVSPPKAGKTILLKKIANCITESYPEVHLIMLLIDERPEEVTDIQRSVQGEVVFSTFDEAPEHHVRVSEMVLARAQRLVEQKKDVVILMDSITRLARAYNIAIVPTGRLLSGGLDPGALHKPKRFFGAARNVEEGGSLTIIATALVETGSRLDDIIYEEFKGTGNMELHLDRKLSEKRIFPAIDLNRSGTRREHDLLNAEELEGMHTIRRILSSNNNTEATEQMISMIEKTRNNTEFLLRLKNWINISQKDGYSYSRKK